MNAKKTPCCHVYNVQKPSLSLLGIMETRLVCNFSTDYIDLLTTYWTVDIGGHVCNTCQLKAKPSSLNPEVVLHVYTHGLVRCNNLVEDPIDLDQTTNVNSEIREGMLNLKENFDGRLTGLEDRLKRLEEKLNWLTENMGRT